jgi:hypothetical protein
MTKGQTMIKNTLHRKIKIEQHELHSNPGVYSCAPEGLAVSAPLVTPVVLRYTFQEYPVYSLVYRLLTNKVHFVINKELYRS